MKKSWLAFFGTFGVASLLSCCSATNQLGKQTSSWMATATSKVSHLSEMTIDRVRPAGVRVVEVREQDLKELPTGSELALAFERNRKADSWMLNGPVDFIEPNLPEMGGEMDGSLLPPRQP